jgi:hypothetical protein
MYVNEDISDFDGIIEYTINNKDKLTANPGAFFYYTKLPPYQGGSTTYFTVQQGSSPESFFFDVVKNNIKLWLVTGDKCAQVQLRGNDIPGTTGGNGGFIVFSIPYEVIVPLTSYYVVSVKYDTDTVMDPDGETVDFTFAPTHHDQAGVVTSGITLAPKEFR